LLGLTTTQKGTEIEGESVLRLRIGKGALVDRARREIVVPFDDYGLGGFGEGCVA
jgi:hypothetical protein